MQYLFEDWKDIQEICFSFLEDFKKYKPDVLIGIARGGLVPLKIVSDMLDMKNIDVLQTEFYSDIGKTLTKPKFLMNLSKPVKDKKILLIDDVADSGKTLKFVKEYLLEKGVKEVKVFTIHYKKSSVIVPDFYGKETDKWIVYPWDKAEFKRLKR